MKATILSVLCFTALATAGTAVGFTQISSVLTPVSAAAFISAELISPTSYEQYLSLKEPSSVAATDGYTAIADGNILYVYDRASGVYLIYDGHAKKIESLQFDESGNLYFLSSLNVYRLSLAALRSGAPAAEKLTDVSCTGFLIHGDSLYYTTSNEICVYSLSSGTISSLITEDGEIESVLAFTKDTLYYLCESAETPNLHTMYAIDPVTKGVTPVTDFSVQIRSMTIANNLLCFTTKSGALFTYNHTELTASELVDDVAPITKDENGYVSLCAYDGNVYAIRKNVVRHYSVAEAAFTDFEIGASSTSAHRLNGATDAILSENRLFIADVGNERISVYNTENKTFETPIPSALPDPYLASYGETLLVSSSTEAVLYSLSAKNYGEPLLTVDDAEIEGNIIGTASVYGRYYVLTDDNHCYAFNAESGEWTFTESQKKLTMFAMALTADVYGSLYVAYDNDAVYRFTEKELVTAEASGVKILDGLQRTEKIAVDYETNLYALSQGTLTKYTPAEGDHNAYMQSATYTPSYPLVNDAAPVVRSFAFGVKDPSTYFLYEGDYVVKSDELQIPTVNPIPVGDAANRVFSADNTEFSVVTVATDAILIEFDINALQGATKFPYVAFEHCQEAFTALKIGEEQGYSILAVSQEKAGEYKTYLVLNDQTTITSDYLTKYETPKEGHLTNDVSLYKFPYLTGLLTVEELTRGEGVELLGEVHNLDRAYYKIRLETENGEKIGYVPTAYVTLFDGSAPAPETVTYGDAEESKDAVWRFAYILLGFGAIGILVDFLILRKPKDEETDKN